jgi:hypothetical protein
MLEGLVAAYRDGAEVEALVAKRSRQRERCLSQTKPMKAMMIRPGPKVAMR